MWLINTTSFRLEYFADCDRVQYAILSHTWGDDEVSFQEFQTLQAPLQKKGYQKIEMTCALAKQRGLNYAWVDTCCIDKTNNVELTEAINSMFRWYQKSAVCFAYLSDLPPRQQADIDQTFDQLRHSCWFSRGWTLQELIAPKSLEILDRDWGSWGEKSSLAGEIEMITGIDTEVLLNSKHLKAVAVARKMSWAAARITTRLEDIAYCLLGIFDINMPMIYGEGSKAFIRLQEEISKETNDLSLFAWTAQLGQPGWDQPYRGILATSPVEFKDCSDVQRMSPTRRFDQDFVMTNKGLRIKTVLTAAENSFVFNLQCFDTSYQSSEAVEWLGIFLTQTPGGFVRTRPTEYYIPSRTEWHPGEARRIYIPRHLTYVEALEIDTQYAHTIGIHLEMQPYRVVTAGPEMLWDSSKGLYLTGDICQFTGYLHLRADLSDFPPFDFLVVCGRRHATHNQSQHELEHWCVVEVESGEEWSTIFELIGESTQVADVASLDYLSQGIEYYGRQLSSSDSCTFAFSGSASRVKVEVSMERCNLGDLRSDLASIGNYEAHCINIRFSVAENI